MATALPTSWATGWGFRSRCGRTACVSCPPNFVEIQQGLKCLTPGEVWPGYLCLLPTCPFVTRAGALLRFIVRQGPYCQLSSAQGVLCSPADAQLPTGGAGALLLCRRLVQLSSSSAERQLASGFSDDWLLLQSLHAELLDNNCATCALTYACLAACLPSTIPTVAAGSRATAGEGFTCPRHGVSLHSCRAVDALTACLYCRSRKNPKSRPAGLRQSKEGETVDVMPHQHHPARCLHVTLQDVYH